MLKTSAKLRERYVELSSDLMARDVIKERAMNRSLVGFDDAEYIAQLIMVQQLTGMYYDYMESMSSRSQIYKNYGRVSYGVSPDDKYKFLIENCIDWE